MSTQQEVIKSFMKSLDTTTFSGVTALNNAVKACSSFESLQSVIDKLISDCTSATSVENFLEEKCGIILDNTDTGAITGSDAGGSKIKTAESIVPESGTGSYPSGTSFTKRGLTVVIPSKSTLTKDQQTVVQGLYSWWIEEALKLIEESYGYSFTDSDATVKKITLEFENNSSDKRLAYVSNHSTSANDSAYVTTELTLTINMGHFKNLSTSNVDGKSGNNYLDRTIAHELTHAIMAAKIDDYSELPNFIVEGMAELTHGIDDERASDIKQLVANPTQLEACLNVNINVSPTDLYYSAGYIFLRYLAKQGAGDFSGGTGNTINYTISGENTSINAGGTYTIAKDFTGNIAINTTEAVTIDGTSAGDLSDVSIFTRFTTIDLTIKNLNITNETNSIITFGSDTDNKFTISGKNILKTSDTWAAVVNIGGGLTIDGSGSLDVTAGSQGTGIGYNSYKDSTANLTINGANITTSADMGAGIGSGYSGSVGNITIGGNANVTATANQGAGIGSGYSGSAGNITIGDSANVTATSEYGAGLGKGCDSDTKAATVGDITISGNSSVLITQMNPIANTVGFEKPTEFKINGNTYTKSQLLFEKGVEKNLSERIIIRETKTEGTDNADKISEDNSRLYELIIIDSGAGDDTINANGTNFLIYAGDGNDSIQNLGKGLSGTALIGGYVTLDAGAGNDTVWIGSNMNEVDGHYSSINGGANNDSIRVNGNYCTVEGGAGNDNIVFQGKYSTLYGGTGNDTIRFVSDSASNTIEYKTGDGFDRIHDFKSTDTLNILGNSYSTTKSGSDIIVTVDEGEITLVGAATLSDVNITTTSTFLTVTNTTKSPVTVDSAVKVIDASKRTKAVKITGNALANSIVGGDGKDTIDGSSGNDTLRGGKGQDSIVGGTGNDSLWGGDDDDIMGGNAGNDKLFGEAGNDKLWGDDGNDTLDGGAGNDALKGGAGKDSIVGGTGNDSLWGGDDDDIMGGNTGSDKLFGEAGNDKLWGDDGNDTLDGGAGNDALKGGKGQDSIVGGTGNDSLWGGNDNDIMGGNAGNDKLFGEAGNDKLWGDDGNDTLDGGAGNDALKGGKGKDSIVGGLDNDSLWGGDDNDIMGGNAGNDKLFGESGNDKLWGDDGNDTLDGGAGNDALKGGKGKDSIVGGADNDSLWGGDDDDIMGGNTGNDKLFGEAGNDKLWGDDGNDTLDGGAGNDALKGGKGKDSIVGGADNDSLWGGDDNDIMGGNAGNDKIFGEAGNDKLWGDDGNDTLDGGAGNDALKGGKGQDSLWGGAGNDSLWGGDGNDIFVYKPNEGTDTICDYASGDMLKILKADGSEGGSFTKSAFASSKLTLTINGGGSVIFSDVYSGDKININSKNYTISGKTLR